MPSCKECNQQFSLDEQYFVVLLAHISSRPTLTVKLDEGGTVDRALQRAPALDERVLRSLEVTEEGTVAIRPETDRVYSVIQKIGLGLFVLRYRRVPRLDQVWPVDAYSYDILDQRPWPLFVSLFTERFKAKPWTHIQKGVFSYIVIRDPRNYGKLWCVMDFHQTLWGVVGFPNPRIVKPGETEQPWLFDLPAT